MATEEMMGAASFKVYAEQHGIKVTAKMQVAVLDNGEWWAKDGDAWYRR